MTRTSYEDQTDFIARIRDMLLAYRSDGKDLDDVVAEFDRVVARRNKRGHQQ